MSETRKELIRLKTSAQSLSRTIVAALALSLSYFAYVRSLVPLYGETATLKYLRVLVISVTGIAISAPLPTDPLNLVGLASILLTASPTTSYWVALSTARKHEPVKGPIITHVIVMLPIVYLLSSIIAKSQNWLQDDSAVVRRLAAFMISYMSIVLAGRLWAGPLSPITNSQILLALSGSLLALAFLQTVTAPPPPTKENKGKQSNARTLIYKLRFPIAIGGVVAWTFLTPITLSSPVLKQPLKGTYLHPTYPLAIHSSTDSLTGLIVVGEGLPPPPDSGIEDSIMSSIRYLRASHSILGGVWTHEKVMSLDGYAQTFDSFGTPLGDSIYAAFVLQEAARLVNSTKSEFNNALTIGLGTGVAATGFSRHGMNNTIVEIDPAVYEAARTWFGLPDPGPGRVFLEDARGWVANAKSSQEPQLFDIVIHDCFSGGGVPKHIFTLEFWNDLNEIIHPEGVLAVNFAGIPESNAAKAILLTLETAFPQCRAFHDLPKLLDDEGYKTEFINIVFFCTRSSAPLTFRKAKMADYINSPLRQHVLGSLPKRELDLERIRGPKEDSEALKDLVLTDKHNPLGKWQEAEAMHHWEMMRRVLSDVYWETY